MLMHEIEQYLQELTNNLYSRFISIDSKDLDLMMKEVKVDTKLLNIDFVKIKVDIEYIENHLI